MKFIKILFPGIVLPFLFLFLGCKVSAYTDQVEYVAQYCLDNYGITITDVCKQNLDNNWLDLGVNKLWVRPISGSRLQFWISSNVTNEESFIYSGSPNRIVYSDIDTNTINNNVTSTYSEYPTQHYFGTREDVTTHEVLYSSNIPAVSFKATFIPYLDTILPSGPETYCFLKLENLEGYYNETIVYFYMPIHVTAKLENGTYTFNPDYYVKSDPYTLYDGLTDGEFDTDYHTFSPEDINDLWSDFFNDVVSNYHLTVTQSVQTSLAGNETTYDLTPNSEYVWIQNLYYSLYRMPFSGNRMEVYSRWKYFQGTTDIVGKWTHWYSSTPKQFSYELPEYALPYKEVPGIETEPVTKEILPEQSEPTLSPIGTPTGYSPESQIYFYDPQYPQYPTIVSFNHDNLLQQFIETANYLGDPENGFFGQFVGFCTATFAWMPSQIWVIIGFGLLGSIGIMILKVL